MKDLLKHYDALQVKLNSKTKLFILRSLKVGVLFISEHKKLNRKLYTQFVPTLRRRTHGVNTNFG